ncbi:flavin reductase [Caulobacter sp. CCNWLY153]|uniref:flavin reductase n=1 Tax=unclassified Caulobacter TaxID=2648921 RepID=UPI002FEE8128
MPNLTVVAVFRALPGKAEALGEGLLALVDPTRREAGNLRYEIGQSIDEPEAWLVQEIWREPAPGGRCGRRLPDLHRWRSGMGQVAQRAIQAAGRPSGPAKPSLETRPSMTQAKHDYPLDQTRRFLETGPIVLISSAYEGETNIMTLGWHMMLGFAPALVGTYIWTGNHSYDLIRQSGECVINLPTVDLLDAVVAVGNSTGGRSDKFESIGLTPVPAQRVGAPLIAECYANFECRLIDDSQVDRRGLFIWEVVKAHVAGEPDAVETLHYRGEGLFMVAGRTVSRRERFKPQNL